MKLYGYSEQSGNKGRKMLKSIMNSADLHWS